MTNSNNTAGTQMQIARKFNAVVPLLRMMCSQVDTNRNIRALESVYFKIHTCQMLRSYVRKTSLQEGATAGGKGPVGTCSLVNESYNFQVHAMI